MIVAKVMTRNPVFIRPDMLITDVKSLMMREKIKKLPVVDRSGILVGILTEADLRKACPSLATSLDVYELGYLLSKIKAEKVMQRNVLTVAENDVVEEAARIMADNEVDCLPVMKDTLLTGIITESDLFRTFIDMFGTRYSGVRATFLLEEKTGQIAQLAGVIAQRGGNIVSLVTSEAEDMSKRRCTCKIAGMKKDDVLAALTGIVTEMEDIR